MKRIWLSMSVCLLPGLHATGAVSPHPNLMWTNNAPFDSCTIEISNDRNFVAAVDTGRVDNVSRYVPMKPLVPGDYFWRVKNRGGVVENSAFSIERPLREIVIPAGSGMAEIQAALNGAEKNPSTRIVFEKGEYHLHPGENGTVFDINGTTNLIVDGGGSKFVVHDIARLAEVRFSQHITFCNLTVDYDVPIHTAAKVEAVASDGTLELSLWPGCAAPESVPRFMEEQRGMFHDPAYPRMAENVPLLVYMKDPWEPLGEGRYRLKAAKPSSIANVRPGMVYICAPRYKPQGFELYNSDDITIADVTTYYLPGIGVVTSFVNDLKLIRMKMLRREDRLLGVQNGGTNIHNARIGPWVEGCRFENTGDDCNHISSLVLTPVGQPEPAVVVVSSQQPGTRGFSPDMDIQPGDALAFFDRPSGRVLAEAKVLSAELLADKTTRIVFYKKIPELVCGTGRENPDMKVAQVYNLSRSCGSFVFRNNTFFRGRRVGVLAKSGPGLIENNRFEELGGGGVEIFNAPFEGLYAHDVLIQNNLFRRGGLVYKDSGPAPAIWIEIFAGDLSQRLNRNIRIIGNRIVDYPGNGIEVCDSVNLRVEGNHFENGELSALRKNDAVAIKLSNVENAVIGGNGFADRRFSNTHRIEMENCINVEIVK